MYAYIYFNGRLNCFRNIGLTKKFIPHVDTTSVEGLDPSLWFKCLLIDSLLVDCNDKNVYWRQLSSSNELPLTPTKENDFKVDEILEFYRKKERLFKWDADDFDVIAAELFELAEYIIAFCENESGDQTRKEKAILRLLHVFILGKIKLHVTETTDIQNVITVLEQEDRMLQSKQDRENEVKRVTENSLETQRVSLVSPRYMSDVSGYSLEFLEVFVNHLQTDIVSRTDSMMDVDKTGTFTHGCNSDSDDSLQNHRRTMKERRQQTLIYLNNAVIARDKFNTALQRSKECDKEKIPMPKTFYPIESVYMDTHKHLEKAKQNVNALEQAQINLSAVQTATKFALSEIEEKGKSFGHSNAKKVTYDTIGVTLSDKVNELLQSDLFGTPNKLVAFSAELRTNVLRRINTFRKHRDRNSLWVDLHSRSEPELSSLSQNLERVESLKGDLENICETVVKHIAETSKTLAAIIYHIPEHKLTNLQFKNVYICYESNVSTEIMPDIQQHYENCYHGYRKSFMIMAPLVEIFKERQANNNFDVDKDLKLEGEKRTFTVENRPIPSSNNTRKFRSQIRKGIEATSLFGKLKHFSKAIHLVISKHSDHCNASKIQTSADELIDVLTVLLDKIDNTCIQRLYANIKLVEHLWPKFVIGSAYHYAVVSIHAALEHMKHPT